MARRRKRPSRGDGRRGRPRQRPGKEQRGDRRQSGKPPRRGGELLPGVPLSEAGGDKAGSPAQTPRRPARPDPGPEPSPEALAEIFAACGLPVDERERNLFWQYYLRLKERNQEINLTRIHRFRDVVVKHFVDCVLVGELTALPSPLLDIGSGGGFPGVPLKIRHPEVAVVLAEGRAKRVAFLEEVRRSLRLPKLYIHGHQIKADYDGEVRGATTRAVEAVGRTLERCVHFLPPGGRVLLMKGPKVDPEIEVAGEVWGRHFTLTEDHAYKLPTTGHDRRLLVYERRATG
jgi:16S rRNA (guanine527-N7)-methyltransferase